MSALFDAAEQPGFTIDYDADTDNFNDGHDSDEPKIDNAGIIETGGEIDEFSLVFASKLTGSK